jgi:uncharacterized protein with von Willebrand factor type A (vWA) domain
MRITNDTAIEKHIKRFETFFFNHENNTIKRLEIYMFRTCNPEHALKMLTHSSNGQTEAAFAYFDVFKLSQNQSPAG